MMDVQSLITSKAREYGLDPDTMLKIADIESKFDPKARNPSGASGVFQFMPSTWQQYGKGGHVFDAEANVDAGMRFTLANMQVLRNRLGREPTPGEVYLSHQQGAGGASKLMSAPNAPAISLVGTKAVTQNGGSVDMTAQQFANLWMSKMGDTPSGQPRAYQGGAPAASFMGAEDSQFTTSDTGRLPLGIAMPAQNNTREDRVEEARAAEEKADKGYTFWQGAKAAAQNEWSVLAPFQTLPDVDVDPDFRLTEDLVRGYGKDIPDQYLDEFEDAVSEEDMQNIRDRLMVRMERNQKLAEMGAEGTFLSIGAALTDPGAIAATMAISAASGGIGLAPAVAARLGRVGLVGLGAAEGVAGNLAVDIPTAAVDPTRDVDDAIKWSVGAGLLMGGAYGALRRNPMMAAEAERMAGLGQSMQREVVDGKVAQITGSAGAARYVPPAELRAGALEDAEKLSEAAEGIQAEFARARFDVTKQFLTSKNPLMKLVGRHFFEDGVRAGKGKVTEISAQEVQRHTHEAATGIFSRNYGKAFNAYRKEARVGVLGRRPAFKKWERQVIDYVRAADPNIRAQAPASVQQAGAAFEEMTKGYLTKLQDAGLYAREGVGHYVPRYMDMSSISKLIDIHGLDPLADLFKKAVKAVQPNLDDSLAERYGRAIIKRMHESRAGEDFANPKLMSFDVEDLEDTLSGYLSKQDIEDIKASLPKDDTPTSASSTRLRQRITLDENFKAVVEDRTTREMKEVSIADFYIKSPWTVAQLYSRHMSGQLALAQIKVFDPKTGDLIVDGIRSTREWEAFKARARAVGDASGADWNADSNNLDFFYSVLTGTPYRGRNEGDDWATMWRMVRDYNYARMMNQVGLAQIPEIGMVVSRVGIKALYQAIPGYRKMLNSLRTGQATDDLMEEVVTLFGSGTNMERSRFYTAMDDFEAPVQQGGSRLIQRVNETLAPKLHTMGRATSYISLMGPIMDNMQTIAARGVMIRFGDMARGMSMMSDHRLMSLGLDDKMQAKVFDQIKAHAEFFRDGKGKLKAMNLHKWDAETASAFESAVSRELTSTVLESNPGQMAKWMSHPVARMFMQFRTFGLGSWTKVFLQSLNHKDRTAALGALYSTMIGSLVYSAQTRMNLVGDSEADRKIEERLSLDRVAIGGLLRSSHSSLLPMGIDLAAQFSIGEPLLDYRTSGLASDAFLGSPTVDLYNSLSGATSGILTGIAGDDYSQEDARNLRRVLPFQNAVGITQTINALVAGLPAREIRD